jgi:hypothetical protein
MGRKEKSAGDKNEASVEKDAAPRPSMVVEGEEAVELYARQIAFNLTELEKQVELLREACVNTKNLLRDIE